MPRRSPISSATPTTAAGSPWRSGCGFASRRDHEGPFRDRVAGGYRSRGGRGARGPRRRLQRRRRAGPDLPRLVRRHALLVDAPEREDPPRAAADIDPAAQMTLLVDYGNDSTMDFQQVLGATQWHKVQTEIATPRGYSGITFHLRKEGTGTAVLAEMRIESTTGCVPLHATTPVPLNAGCFYATDCAPGLFCDPSEVCLQCSDKVACPGSTACQARSPFLPRQCGPGQGLGQSGAPCIFDDDCAG